MKDLISQNYSGKYEIIVVKNGPPDSRINELVTGIRKTILKKTITIKVVEEPRIGLHYARHTGAKSSRGRILAYIDDDVSIPPNWLNEMVRAFDNPKVGMVGGKVVGLIEDSDDDLNFNGYESYLSLLDMGSRGVPFLKPHAPYGCNLAIRKEILFEIKGFNPDGFSDQKMAYFRGDGENAVAQKVRDEGHIVWYAPSAMLSHIIPRHRLSIGYLKKRGFNEGLSSSFSAFRSFQHSRLFLIRLSIENYVEFILRNIYSLLSFSKNVRYGRRVASHFCLGVSKHSFWLVINRKLRSHVTKEHFMD
jgi:glucosyl-dolichyl phosphate glucuronosyltransferase